MEQYIWLHNNEVNLNLELFSKNTLLLVTLLMAQKMYANLLLHH
jgi:hypothetical protein